MARVISGTYHNGIYLLFPSDNPITVTGEILGPSYGIYASSDQSWNVDNQGVVSGAAGNGIDLEGGGYVLNEGTYPNRSSATIMAARMVSRLRAAPGLWPTVRASQVSAALASCSNPEAPS